MRKLTTILVCTFAVLAFAVGAAAQNEDFLDEDHVDHPEKGTYVFWSEEDMEAFIDELEAEWEAGLDDAGLDDFCLALRPEVYYVSTLHFEGTGSEHWHTTTYVTWNSDYTRYEVHEGSTGSHMWDYVDGQIVGWRHSASVCPYCDWEDWESEFWMGYTNYGASEYQSCWNTGYPYAVVYYYKGEEYDGLDDDGLGSYLARFDRDGTGTDSFAYLTW